MLHIVASTATLQNQRLLMQHLCNPEVNTKVILLVKRECVVSIQDDIFNRGIHQLQVEVQNQRCDCEIQFCVCETAVVRL